ncbi:hypothetical protein NBRC13296_20080 [Paenibacillus chitinolyticus]|uniref:hypothetical protein n=1 Tax=Paenibacillus chitinolyticus TaxID=79263 RepID=UPI00355899B2
MDTIDNGSHFRENSEDKALPTGRLILQAVRDVQTENNHAWTEDPEKFQEFYAKQFRVLLGGEKLLENTTGESDFLQEGLEEIIGHYKDVYKTEHLRAIGATLSSYLSLIPAAFLHAMSHHNIALPLDPASTSIQYDGESFYLHLSGSPSTFVVPELSREERRAHLVGSLFDSYMKPVFQRLRELTGIDKHSQWSYAALTLQRSYDNWMDKASTEELKYLLREDYEYVVGGSDPAWFERSGVRDRHPLDLPFKFVPDVYNEGKTVRMKYRCCLYYKLTGTYCYTCPAITEEHRSRRAEEIISARSK